VVGTHGLALGLGDALALGDDGLSEGEGVGIGVAVGVGAGVAVGVDATVGVGVAGRAVSGTVEPQAARPTAAIAVPMTVVSFIAALTSRLRQREHP
jgi:hypothetical protein